VCEEFNVLFEEAIKMLSGIFVAERVSGVREWYDAHPAPAPGSDEKDALLPEIRTFYDAAAMSFTAVDTWDDALKMMQCQRRANAEFAEKNIQVLIAHKTLTHTYKHKHPGAITAFGQNPRRLDTTIDHIPCLHRN
jgi:hypothetical protein